MLLLRIHTEVEMIPDTVDRIIGYTTDRVDQIMRMFDLDFNDLFEDHKKEVAKGPEGKVTFGDDESEFPTTLWVVDNYAPGKARLVLISREEADTGLWYLDVWNGTKQETDIHVETTEEWAMGIKPENEVWYDFIVDQEGN